MPQRKRQTLFPKVSLTWKKATEYFRVHQRSECHKTFQVSVKFCKNIVEMVDNNSAKLMFEERKYFKKVMETFQFLGRQGLPFQGDNANDNFTQLLLFRGKDDKRVSEICKLLKNTMETIGEIGILIKYSPKREKRLGEIKGDIISEDGQIEETKNSASIDKLCPTRWTVRAKCYKKIIDNYDPLIELFEYCLTEGNLNAELKARLVVILKWQTSAFCLEFI